ncbi:MAG: hypothetical protein HY241_09305 [Actinobacteria bacterium]|nr:hypothetical protein [Actinomycetota bacterium]
MTQVPGAEARAAAAPDDRDPPTDQHASRRRVRRRRVEAAAGPPPAAPPTGGPPPAAAPPTAGPPPRRDSTERGLRGLVGAGPSQLTVTSAMRARDAAHPGPEHLAAAERDLVIVRRHYLPPESRREG